MLRLEIISDAFKDSFRSPRLWLLQFFANPMLFALFVAWLFIPVASNLHLAYNLIFGFVLTVAVLALHAGTLNSFVDRQSSQNAPLWPAFRRALSHLIPVAICVAVFGLLWLLAGKTDAYQSNVPPYVRSTLPVALRRHITLPTLDNLFSAAVFFLRWIFLPGLLLPLLAQTADHGFRGFDKQGLRTWRKTIFSLNYWIVLVLAALLGVFAIEKLMAWTPNFRTSTIRSEAISLAWRLSVSYLFGLFSWMLACSVVGRCTAARGTSSNVGGDPAA
jgi:hypothetical protein